MNTEREHEPNTIVHTDQMYIAHKSVVLFNVRMYSFMGFVERDFFHFGIFLARDFCSMLDVRKSNGEPVCKVSFFARSFFLYVLNSSVWIVIFVVGYF